MFPRHFPHTCPLDRRTFSLLPCNADGPVGAVGGGIPSQVVMKWTGHSDYKAMKPYIDIAEKVKAEQMSIFEKGLDG